MSFLLCLAVGFAAIAGWDGRKADDKSPVVVVVGTLLVALVVWGFSHVFIFAFNEAYRNHQIRQAGLYDSLPVGPGDAYQPPALSPVGGNSIPVPGTWPVGTRGSAR